MTSSHSPEQAAAIHAEESHFVVRAGAGAGKTKVLVDRFIWLIDQGLRPDQILAITFTKKAAAEMKRRIVTQLRQDGKSELAQIAETGPIQTIHAFCERLLRENALLAGVDPEFEILDSDELAGWLDQALVKRLQPETLENPNIRKLVEQLACRDIYGGAPEPQARLRQATTELLNTLRGTGISPTELEKKYADPDSHARNIESFLLEQMALPVRAAVATSIGSVAVRAGQAHKALKIAAPKWVKDARATDAEFRAESELTCGLALLAAQVWRALEARMKSEQRFDFTLLEAEALRFVESAPEGAQRVRGQYRAALIDETQDVNPIQYRIVEGIAAERQMMVGDPQQSIYSFRQADRRLFVTKNEALPTKSLTLNFRSSKGILNFVDAVFSGPWQGEYVPMKTPGNEEPGDDPFGPIPTYEGVEWWKVDKHNDRFVAGNVAKMLAEGVSPGDVAILTQSNRCVTRYADALRKYGLPVRVVGGVERFYARLEVRDLSNCLEALSNPSNRNAMLALLHADMVNLSLDAIVLLGRASKEGSVWDVVRAFVSPVESDGPKLARFLDWFEPMSRRADRLNAWELIAEIYRDTPYLERLAQKVDAPQYLANARKLMSIATTRPDLGPREFAATIREIQRFGHRENDATALAEEAVAVTVMTIFRAKGLEFPVVVLPEMFENLRKKSRSPEVDASQGLVTTDFLKKTPMAHLWNVETRVARNREESLRVLYVAMTRAKSRLCFCAETSSNRDNWSKFIADQAGLGKIVYPGMVVRE